MITILDLRKSTRKLKINDSENEVLIDDGGDTNEVNSFDSSADEFGNGLNKIRESNTTIERSSSSSTSSSPTLFKQRLAKSSRVRKNNKEYKNNSNSLILDTNRKYDLWIINDEDFAVADDAYKLSKRDIRNLWIFIPYLIFQTLFSLNGTITEHYGLQCTRNFIVDIDTFLFNKTVYAWLKVPPFQNPLFDLLSAMPYLFHFLLPFAYAFGYLAIYKRAYLAFYQYIFAFGLVTSVAVIVQYILPTPPPWMFEGLPREANFARVDNMLALPIFKSIYAHSPLVCGAFPSLHTAFPALIAFGRKPWFTRSFCWLHVVWIGCAAVYSLHHWIIDVAFGVLFAWAACQLSNFVINRCIVSQIRGYPDPRLIRHYHNKNGIYANVV